MKQETVNELVKDDGVGDFVADLSEDDWKLKQREDGEGGDASLPGDWASPKVNYVVGCVVRSHVGFDYQDVLELQVEGVLERCGLNVELEPWERRLLSKELFRIGECSQTVEMVRMTSEEPDRLVLGLPDNNWSFRSEVSFRKAFLALLRRKHEQERAGGRSDVAVAGRLGLRKWCEVMPSVLDGVPVGEMGM